MKHALLILLMVAAACSKQNAVAADANQVANTLPATNETTTNAEGGPPLTTSGVPSRTVASGSATPAAVIPPLLQGRWGLTPKDCTSTRGDAKGLLVIGPNELRFYESRAVPTTQVTNAADSISGDFRFTGEGQSWTKFEALERRPEGLVRTERNPNVSFTYARCD